MCCIDTYDNSDMLLIDTRNFLMLLICTEIKTGEYWFCTDCKKHPSMLIDLLNKKCSFNKLMTSMDTRLVYRSYDDYDNFVDTDLDSQNYIYPNPDVYLFNESPKIEFCIKEILKNLENHV